MAHFIQPIAIVPSGGSSTEYCLDQKSGRMTRGVNTDYLSTATDLADVSDLDSPWIMTVVGLASNFELSFGVGCGDTINLSFNNTGSATAWQVDYSTYVNHQTYSSNSFTDSTTLPHTDSVTISDVACGSLITVLFNVNDWVEAGLSISMEVTTITT